MSGSKEERPSAAGKAVDEPSQSGAAPETVDAEAPAEMTAAEALARATAEAAETAPPTADPTDPPPAGGDTSSDPEPAAEAGGGETAAAPAAETEAKVEGKQVEAEAAAEEPAAKEPAAKEPAAKEPAAKEPAAKEPAAKEPATKESAAEEPAAKEPAAEMPAESEIETPAEAQAEESAAAKPETPIEEDSEEPAEAEAEIAAEGHAQTPVATEGETSSEAEVEAETSSEAEVEAKAEAAGEADAAAREPIAADPEPGEDSTPEPAVEAAGESEPAAGTDRLEAGEAAAAPSEKSQKSRKPEKSGKSGKSEKSEKPAKPAKPGKPEKPERPELQPVLEAMKSRQSLEGRVIGWNNGGFHLALGDQAAFCPRSEMEIGDIQEPESYLDKSFLFRVLRLQGKGRRIVVSRAAHLRNEKSRQRNDLRKRLKPGTELEGTVASLTDFGAFVDLGGAQGLVHVSELSHSHVEHPSEVLEEGQQVKVKVLKVEQGGRRISLSMRALEPDPWKDLADRFPSGAVVSGKVEKANDFGAFIELAPGLTGLLPAKQMSIPRETNPARAYPPGKVVSVQIVAVDPRRRRISLALEGSGLEGSRTDYKEYQRQSGKGSDGEGFNALASAFRRLHTDDD